MSTAPVPNQSEGTIVLKTVAHGDVVFDVDLSLQREQSIRANSDTLSKQSAVEVAAQVARATIVRFAGRDYPDDDLDRLAKLNLAFTADELREFARLFLAHNDYMTKTYAVVTRGERRVGDEIHVDSEFVERPSEEDWSDDSLERLKQAWVKHKRGWERIAAPFMKTTRPTGLTGGLVGLLDNFRHVEQAKARYLGAMDVARRSGLTARRSPLEAGRDLAEASGRQRLTPLARLPGAGDANVDVSTDASEATPRRLSAGLAVSSGFRHLQDVVSEQGKATVEGISALTTLQAEQGKALVDALSSLTSKHEDAARATVAALSSLNSLQEASRGLLDEQLRLTADEAKHSGDAARRSEHLSRWAITLAVVACALTLLVGIAQFARDHWQYRDEVRMGRGEETRQREQFERLEKGMERVARAVEGNAKTAAELEQLRKEIDRLKSERPSSFEPAP